VTLTASNERLSTQEILQSLYDIEESPWAELKGKPLTPRGLASLLRPYHVKSRDVRVGDKTLKGYYSDDLWDGWERYLPAS
jgi:hypothetical protein